MKGLIFSVRRYSIHDGPGIRVTFFMKGCPLSCWWCHNPEGISPQPERIEVIEKVGDIEFLKSEEAGRYYEVNEIIDILDREKTFISESNGGVTFSGGEPMMQIQFLEEALKECKLKGYHTAVDTSGYSQTSNFDLVIPFTDLFLFDLKHMDSHKHWLYTGVPNQLIMDNLKYLLDKGKNVMVRIPIIPEFNDDDLNLEKYRAFLIKIKSENLQMVNLLPYHKTGSSKYRRLNKPDRMNGFLTSTTQRMNELKEFFEETGIKVKIGG
jgi:pyruvate formate lyase activating enzyme